MTMSFVGMIMVVIMVMMGVIMMGVLTMRVIVLHCHDGSVTQEIVEFSLIAMPLRDFHMGLVTSARWEACPDRGRQSSWRR